MEIAIDLKFLKATTYHEKIRQNSSKITTCKWFPILNYLSVL